MSEERKYVLKTLLWRWEDDGEKRYIIYANRQNKLVLLNPVASLIFAELAERTSITSIVEQLSARFKKVNKENIKRDVELFVKQLISTGDLYIV